MPRPRKGRDEVVRVVGDDDEVGLVARDRLDVRREAGERRLRGASSGSRTGRRRRPPAGRRRSRRATPLPSLTTRRSDGDGAACRRCRHAPDDRDERAARTNEEKLWTRILPSARGSMVYAAGGRSSDSGLPLSPPSQASRPVALRRRASPLTAAGPSRTSHRVPLPLAYRGELIIGAWTERKSADRQLDALLERLDRLTAEIKGLNRRLDAGENLAPLVYELRALNESLSALAYAAPRRRPGRRCARRAAAPAKQAIR